MLTEDKIEEEEYSGSSNADVDSGSSDAESDGSEYCGDSEDNQDEDAYRRHRKEKAKVVVSDFLRRVEENRFNDFKWPPDPETPTYKLGMTSPYHRVFSFENKANTDEDICRAKKFLFQVRTSWGYDVDCVPTKWLRSYLYPTSVDCPEYGERVRTSADFAVQRINEQAVVEIHKTFELVRIEKCVKTPTTIVLLTLTIKETVSGAEKIVRVAVSNQIGCGPEILECHLVPSTVLKGARRTKAKRLLEPEAQGLSGKKPLEQKAPVFEFLGVGSENKTSGTEGAHFQPSQRLSPKKKAPKGAHLSISDWLSDSSSSSSP